MTKRLAAATLLAALLTTTACNTVRGLGEDIQSVGEAGERAISYAPQTAPAAQPQYDAQRDAEAAHAAR